MPAFLSLPNPIPFYFPPLLGVFGYAPGAREPQALQALTWAYCLLPCVLKLAAGGLLFQFFVRKGSS